MKRILDPYFTTKPKGNGLGLATAYSIVKNHNGLMTVESEVHVGTMFTIYLPAALDQEMPVEAPRTFTPAMSGTGRVLVVDDEDAIRDLVEFTLTRLGYKVWQAATALEGVDIYREKFEAGERFDAVILDLTLPGGMGGKEALRKINPNRSDRERDWIDRLRHRRHHEPLSDFRLPRRHRQTVRSGRARQNCLRRDRIESRYHRRSSNRSRRVTRITTR